MSDELTLDISINEAVRRFPATIALFNELQIDACCGGALSIQDAAVAQGLDPAWVLERARQALEVTACSL